jgi:ASC-1-like (ASCH) protein
MSFLKSDPSLSDPNHCPLPQEEQAVLDKLARKVVQWGGGMTVSAILFLESVKPANFIMSQVLVFFEPIIQSVFSIRDYDTFRSALEKRETIEILIQKIEAYDAIAQKRDKAFKKWYKQEKKKWKWYQRYLGVFPPRLDPPDDIKQFNEQLKMPSAESDSSSRNT